MVALPVQEMVLYKHGVGFFVRQGNVSGAGTALTFRQDEINDVLKSLTVFDQAGGQVLGIHYQTPMDKDARLASSSIRLSTQASLRDLLTGLRGRSAQLQVEAAPGALETMIGRVIGLDEPQNHPSDSLGDHLLSLLADDNQVRVFRLSTLRALRIQDPQSEHDLTYFLDTSLSEDDRRTVNIRLSEGQHQLVVYYVAPSPSWRVSYRLVAESDEGGEGGKALLQGWGLFDNRLEEDLEDVRVTLVAGQPISFIYDLYASRIPQRPTVQDESRVAPGPVEFAGAAGDMLLEEDTEVVDALRVGGVALSRSQPFAGKERRIQGLEDRSVAALAASAAPAAQTKAAGEFFQYIVTAPVSVKRGESALVPIIGSEVSYQRELLYNGAKLPDHPVVALRFMNTTALTLERGPVTVVENGDYKGEAVIPFTKDGSQVYLPYAVELGVQIIERSKRHYERIGLTIRNAYFIYEMYYIEAITYLLENTTTKDVTVTVEIPMAADWTWFDTPPPDVSTLTEHRWRVEVPARSKVEFIVQRRQRTERAEEVRKLDYRKLQEILQNHWLNEGINKLLTDILETMAHIQNSRAKLTELANERKTLYERQEQLRANLGALQASGQEAALRTRMLGQLEASQNRLEALDHDVETLKQQIADAEKKVNQIIAGLG